MRLVGVLKTVARLAVAAVLFGVMAPMASNKAAAGFGVASPTDAAEADKAATASKGGNTYTKEEIQAREEARKRAEEEAEKNPAPPRAPAKAKVVKPAPVPVVKKDEVVDGCAPGKICIVCVAGCNAGPQSIVHSITKKPSDKQ